MLATEERPPWCLATLRQLPGLQPRCSATTAAPARVPVCRAGCLLTSEQLLLREDFALSIWGGGETTFLLAEGKLAFSQTCPDLPQGEQTEVKLLLLCPNSSRDVIRRQISTGSFPDRPCRLPATTQEHCTGCDRGTLIPNFISLEVHLYRKKTLPTKRHPQGRNPSPIP